MSEEQLTTGDKEQLGYKYNTGGELFNEWLFGATPYFESFFKSYGLNKRTFVIQCFNFTLVCILLGFFLRPFLSVITSWLEGLRETNFTTQFVFIIVTLFLAPMVFRNKSLQWQKLFEMKHKLTKKCFKGLMISNIIAYFLTPESLYGGPKAK